MLCRVESVLGSAREWSLCLSPACFSFGNSVCVQTSCDIETTLLALASNTQKTAAVKLEDAALSSLIRK